MKLIKRIHLKEAWLAFFILGVIMLNFPFIQIFNKDTLVFGVPLLILYLLIGWPFSIFVIFLFSRALKAENEIEQIDEEGETDRS